MTTRWVGNENGDKNDNTTRIWDVATGREIRRWTQYDDYLGGGIPGLTAPRSIKIPGGVMAVAVSPNGQQIATGTATVRIWDAASGAMLHELGKCDRWACLVGGVFSRWHPAGFGLPFVVQIWDVVGGHETRRLDVDDIMSVAFSPDGKTVGTREADGSMIRLWDAASGRELHRLEGLTKDTGALAFSPDGRTVAAGAMGEIKIWEPAESKIINPAEGQARLFSRPVYSPDGTIIATATDARIWVWALASGRLLKVLAGHTDGISSMAFSPDGSQLASAGWEGTLRLWDVANGQETHRFEAGARAAGGKSDPSRFRRTDTPLPSLLPILRRRRSTNSSK